MSLFVKMNFFMEFLFLTFLCAISAIPTGANDSVHSVSRESGKALNCNCGYNNVSVFVIL